VTITATENAVIVKELVTFHSDERWPTVKTSCCS